MDRGRAGTPPDAAVRPIDVVSFAYMAGLAIVVAAGARGAPAWGRHLAVHAGGALLTPLVLLLARRVRHPLFRFARDWYVTLAIGLAFFESRELVPRIGGDDLDRDLMAMDLLLCGGHPARFIDAWQSPGLTDVFRAFWMSYFVLPFAVLVPLWLRPDPRAFHRASLAVALGLFVSYAGYYIVPALGPGYFPGAVGRTPSAVGTTVDRVLDVVVGLEGDMRDTYPSGHVIIASVAVWAAVRFRIRGLRIPVAVAATGLAVATLYLRYHYLVDVLAGLVIGAIVLLVASAWTTRWERAVVSGFSRTGVAGAGAEGENHDVPPGN